MNAKFNRSQLHYPDSLSPEAIAELPELQNHAIEWWWGTDRNTVHDAHFDPREWGRVRMPLALVGCGNLIRMHIRSPSNTKHPRRQKDASIELSRALAKNSWVAFDRHHPNQRLYLIIQSQAASNTLKHRFWDENDIPSMPLNQLAKIAGGKHGTNDYPDVEVKPIGILTALVYWAHKKGDGPSYYIHQMGELTRHYPIIACDDQGRLWLAGGAYNSPTPGITN